MNWNMGRRSSGGRHGGLNMLVSACARVRPDIVMMPLLPRCWGVAMEEVTRGVGMMPVVQTYQPDYDSR